MKTLLIASLLLVATGVNAQTAFPINGDGIQNKLRDIRDNVEMKAEQGRDRIQLHKEDMLENAEEKQRSREEKRVKLQERRQDKVQGMFNGVYNHLDTIAQRFEDIVERFESRLSKMEGVGVDVSDTIEILDEAKFGVEDLKNVIAETQATIDTLLEGEFSRDDINTEMGIVKEAVKETKKSIIDALQTFKASIKTDTIEE
jgi:hypothetical protein